MRGNHESYGEFMDSFRQEVLPSLDDAAEYATEGFKAMLLEGQDSYETSHEKIDRANGILSDAEAKWERTSRKIDRTWARTQTKLLSLHERLLELNATILSDWIDTVEPYIPSDYPKTRHLETRLASQIEFATLDVMRMESRLKIGQLAEIRRARPNIPDLTRLDRPSLERILPDILVHTSMPQSISLARIGIVAPTGPETLLDSGRSRQQQRIEMADEFLSKVVDFRAQVEAAVAEANREMVKCRAISKLVEEAHSVFDRLAEWMVQKTGEIKAMSADSSDRSALEAAIDVSVIFACLIHDLGCTPILDGSDLSPRARDLISCAQSMVLEVER